MQWANWEGKRICNTKITEVVFGFVVFEGWGGLISVRRKLKGSIGL